MIPNPDLGPGDTHDIFITRAFNAPRELVWKMFTQPQHMMKWWGPKGFTTPVCEIDLRPGGIWHYVMRAPDGSDYSARHIYHEIAAPERIVYGPAENDAGSLHPTHTITFEERDGKTTVSLRTQLPSAAERDEMIKRGFAQGVGEGLDTLEEYLKTL